MTHSTFCCLVSVLLAAQLPAAGHSVQSVAPGVFLYLSPPELRFSCAGSADSAEEKYSKELADEKTRPDKRFNAALMLWRGRSRRTAADVIKYVARTSPDDELFREFKQEVEASVRPEAIARELQEGDYLWATWLAFLHPHKDLVPALLEGLKDKPDMMSETMLSLGNSGDPRALEPLLELLGNKDYRIAGDAAQALGYLGYPNAEPKLIEALAGDNAWRQVNACSALAKLGTQLAVPALEKLAKDDSYIGLLNIKGVAEDALQRIEKRKKR